MSVSQGTIKKQSEAPLSVSKERNTRGVLLTTALMAGYSMIYMDKNMISTAIIPIAEQFHLTTSQTGLIMSLFFLGYSLMQIPGGWLADKIGYKKVLMLSLSLITIFSFAFGLAGSLLMFILIRFWLVLAMQAILQAAQKESPKISRKKTNLCSIAHFVNEWNWRNFGICDWGTAD